MIGEALLVGGAIALYFLFRGRSSSGAPDGGGGGKTDTSALDDQLYKDMMATGSSLDDQLLKDMLAAGGWIPIPPSEVSSMPSKKVDFTVGEVVYTALKKSGTDTVVIAAVQIADILGDESTGTIGRGKTIPLFGSGAKLPDYEQISGSEQPKLGTVVALPIAYRLDDLPPSE